MRVTITQGDNGSPIVTVQGGTLDSPEKVVKAYQEAQKVQLVKEEETK